MENSTDCEPSRTAAVDELSHAAKVNDDGFATILEPAGTLIVTIAVLPSAGSQPLNREPPALVLST